MNPNIDPDLLVRFCAAAAPYRGGLYDGARNRGIDSNAAIAAFLAQFAEETNGFKQAHEVFDYTPEALIEEFHRHITDEQAAALGRQPGETFVPRERQAEIADIVYAGRYGNGDAASGDGSRYRARGPGITFKDNYGAASDALGLDLLTHPEKLEDPYIAGLAGAWYWSNRNLNVVAEGGDFLGVCRVWNVGTLNTTVVPNGYDSRRQWLAKALCYWPADAFKEGA